MASYTVDQKALIAELSVSEPILMREARAIIEQQFFNPAVKKLKKEFEVHKITAEIAGGIDVDNPSKTLEAEFNDPPNRHPKRERDDYSPPNLFSFIGFDKGTDPLKPIRDRLDPNHADGPKMVYKGMDKDHLGFRFEIRAPSDDAIQEHTPLPWAEGISWVYRIEHGLPGIGHYLNAVRGGSREKGSASGGGLQVDAKLRGGHFKPTSYLSKLFNDFLRRATSGKEP